MDGGSEDRVSLGWEAVKMVLWVRLVDTVREDFWGVVEEDVTIFLGDGNAGEGSLGVNEVMPVLEALGGFKD